MSSFRKAHCSADVTIYSLVIVTKELVSHTTILVGSYTYKLFGKRPCYPVFPIIKRQKVTPTFIICGEGFGHTSCRPQSHAHNHSDCRIEDC